MKLKNKKTGEVATLTLSSNGEDLIIMGNDMYAHITKLSELKDYEDYEEPKEYWYLENNGEVAKTTYEGNLYEEKMQEIGNYFDTREKAKKAVRKLNAWKLLKDMGFKIEGIRYRNNKSYIEWTITQKVRDDHFTSEAFNDALHLLFGGEE